MAPDEKKVEAFDQQEHATKSENAPDPFDLDRLKLAQSFVETVGIKRVRTHVPVRKPSDQAAAARRASSRQATARTRLGCWIPFIPPAYGQFVNGYGKLNLGASRHSPSMQTHFLLRLLPAPSLVVFAHLAGQCQRASSI
jgi:hypothetical protein